MTSETRVLIVEDEMVVALDIKRRLRRLGYQIAGNAATGESAISLAKHTQPDIILMDVQLKGNLDGIDTAEQIRQGLDTPIVYLTAYATETILQRAKLTAPYGYLLKPFQERELHSTIEMALNRHRLERQLKESERWLTTILNSIGEAVIATDVQGRVMFLNPVAQGLTGWLETQAFGKQIHDVVKIIRQVDGLPLNFSIEQVIDSETVCQSKSCLTLETRQGRQVPVEYSLAPIKDETGLAIGMVLVLRDITDRYRAEETQRESEDRYRTLIAILPEAVFMLDVDGHIGYASPQAATLFGLESGDTLVGLDIRDLVLVEDGDTTEIILQHVRQNGACQNATLDFVRPNGSHFIGDVAARLLKGSPTRPPAIICTIRDITDRQHVAEEIRRRNRELALLNRIIATAATGSELEIVLETACRELAIVLNIPQVAVTFLDEDRLAAYITAVYADEAWPLHRNDPISIAKSIPYRHILATKTPFIAELVSSSAAPSRSPNLILALPLITDGVVIGSLDLGAFAGQTLSANEISLAWSVADQLASAIARNRLTQTHQRLITAIEQSAESVVITDTQGIILYVNPAFEEITGYNRNTIIGRDLNFLKSGKHDPVFYKEMWQTIRSGKVWHGRFINRKKDGSFFTEDATITPVKDNKGAIVNYVAVKRDVTKELQLEEQYRQAQRMEAIGLLAGGIAHDFNNLLTVINGYAQLMKSSLDAEHPFAEMVDNVVQTGQRATDLVRQLLAFSRTQIIEPKILDLNQLIADLNKMLQRIIGEHITVDTSLLPHLWPIKADPGQIEQILLNLVVNARDAMPHGGHLTIATDNTTVDQQGMTPTLTLSAGEYVLLTVSDTGVGMSSAVKSRIFEPFFSTKEVGQGTGLGLATVYGIVKQSGGDIWVYSEEGQGTIFKIYLPRTTDVPSGFVQPGRPNDLVQGTETILLVEDEPAVRRLTALALREYGYTVLEAENGREAIHLAHRNRDRIQLLLTDMVMPGMSGAVLARELIQTHPELKLLFTSGYPVGMVEEITLPATSIAYLAKPFSPLALVRKVRDVLDEVPLEALTLAD